MNIFTLKKALPLFGILLLFWSCQDQVGKHAKDEVFRYNEHAGISSLDPAFASAQRNIWPCNMLYNSLVQLDDSLNILPDLAKTWNISNDGMTYTFHLRTDVYFHKHPVFGEDSTRIMKAKDVVYSLERLSDPKLAAPGAWVMQSVKKIKALNDSTVQIQLKRPFPAFLGLLSMQYCSIIPREMEELSFRKNPIGTGPFHFKRWEPGRKLVFRKNKLYFETDSAGNSLPYLEAVAITFLHEKQSAFLEFIQGNLDFLSGLDASYKDELLTIRGDLRETYRGKIDMLRAPYLNMEYLGFYMPSDYPEVNSLKLRKAINYGFNRTKMINYLRNGIGRPATHGFIPDGLKSFSKEPYYTYKPDKARRLVKEYIEETGDKNPKVILSTNSTYMALCQFIQRQLQNIGIEVEINVMPAATLRQQRAGGNLMFFRASWIADYPDAQNYMSLFYSENLSPNGPNYTHFQSEKFDSLYRKSLKIPKLKNRIPLYRKMDSMIMSKAVVVPLYYDEVIRFKQENIKNLGINPQNLLDLTRVKKIKDKKGVAD